MPRPLGQEDFRQASLDYNLFSIKTEALLSILGSAVQMAAFCYCLYLLWSGKILYGTMTLFLSQGTKLTSAFNALVRTVPNFLNASVSAHRIRDLFALRPEPGQPVDDALECAAAQGVTVEVDGADFAYDPAQPVLHHAALTAAPGEIVALVGPSGGGKTTMIRLLLGLIHPSEGRACLRTADGQELEMNAALRRFFSYVPQGNTLLSGTIADNLRMVQPEADDAALEQALRAACAWDFVSKMPEGMACTATACPRGRPSGSPSPGPCCVTRRCCCWTRPPPPWTWPPSAPFCGTWCGITPTRPVSSPPTGPRSSACASGSIRCPAASCAS